MNTFVKVLLCILAAIVAVKLLPVLMVPVFVGGLALLLAAGLLLGGVGVVAGVGVGVLAGLLAIALVLLAVLSPIWIPVLAIVGLIALIRRMARA